MANTKKSTTTTVSKDESITKSETKTESVSEVKEKKIKPKQKLSLNDNVSISVSSNVPGLLTYVNHKTGDIYKWSTFGEVQSLYVSDIRAMKSNQPRFLEENWIMIEGIADLDEAYEDVDIDEVLDALKVSHYYENALCPKTINEIFNWSPDDIKIKVPKMKQSTKDTIVIRANELIAEGILDSNKKIKALEESLGCELVVE